MDDVSIYARITADKMLRDLRFGRIGLVFGTVEKVAKQYGISMSQEGRYTKFSASKTKLQLFVQQLHFAGVNYLDSLE